MNLSNKDLVLCYLVLILYNNFNAKKLFKIYI